jgi:hypothetical protein
MFVLLIAIVLLHLSYGCTVISKSNTILSNMSLSYYLKTDKLHQVEVKEHEVLIQVFGNAKVYLADTEQHVHVSNPSVYCGKGDALLIECDPSTQCLFSGYVRKDNESSPSKQPSEQQTIALSLTALFLSKYCIFISAVLPFRLTLPPSFLPLPAPPLLLPSQSH